MTTWYDVREITPKPGLLVRGATANGEHNLIGYVAYDEVLERYKLTVPDGSLIIYDVRFWRFI